VGRSTEVPEMEGISARKPCDRRPSGVRVVLFWWSSPFARSGLQETVDSIKSDTVAIRSDSGDQTGVGELGGSGV